MRICRILSVLVLALILGLLLAAAPVQAKRNVNPRVIPPQAKPFGLSYGDWGARWTKWAYETPYAINPGGDDTGARAAVGQSGPVWFLALVLEYPDSGIEGWVSGGAERSFRMPVGKALFVPAYPVCDSWPLNCATEAEARELNAWWLAHVTELEARVDGRPVRSIKAYGGESPIFSTGYRTSPIPEEWVEPQPTIADGYFFILAPLPVGRHDITWRSVWSITADEIGFDFTVVTEMTYHITVAPR